MLKRTRVPMSHACLRVRVPRYLHASMPCRLTYSCVNFPYVLMCSHTNLFCGLSCSCTNVPCVLTCPRSNESCMLMRSRANVSCVVTCSRDKVVCGLSCLFANMPWALLCLTCQHALDAHVSTCLTSSRVNAQTFLESLGSNGLS